jgi:hypothetical protein
MARRVTEPTLPYIREVLTLPKIQKQSFRILKQLAKAEAFAFKWGSAPNPANFEKFDQTFPLLISIIIGSRLSVHCPLSTVHYPLSTKKDDLEEVVFFIKIKAQ